MTLWMNLHLHVHIIRLGFMDHQHATVMTHNLYLCKKLRGSCLSTFLSLVRVDKEEEEEEEIHYVHTASKGL